MVSRVDFLKVAGGNMIKIYSKFEKFGSICTILLLSIIDVILFIKYSSNIILLIFAYICIVFIVTALLKLLIFPSHIVISNNKIKVFDFPLWATNKFYDKKRGLIMYNCEINIYDVEKIEIITLNREEQLKHIGYKHLSRRYLKINLKYGNPKYVYVGNYSNYQIKKIIKILTTK